jgi:DNA-binding transcriptional LysR family regulator
VRLSCPVSLTQTVLSQVLPDFLSQYPKVQVRVVSSNRRVDVISEGFDVAIRVRNKFDTDATLVVRTFGQSRVLPVASPQLLATYGTPSLPADLSGLPALSQAEHDGVQSWELLDAAGERVVVEIRPRLICGDFALLLEAARRGAGVAMLPEFVCAPWVARGELEVLLPAWSVPDGVMHFVYPSRRGQLPGVRALVEFLAERLPDASKQQHETCKNAARQLSDSAA